MPGIGVDTHVGRLSQRLGLTRKTDPDKIEADLTPIVPGEKQVRFCHLLQYHGRRVCLARKPATARSASCLEPLPVSGQDGGQGAKKPGHRGPAGWEKPPAAESRWPLTGPGSKRSIGAVGFFAWQTRLPGYLGAGVMRGQWRY